jgi:hypothetical protein
MYEEIEINENNEETMELAPANEVVAEEKKSGLGGLIGGAVLIAAGVGVYKTFFSKEAKAKRHAKKLEKAKKEIESAGYFVSEYDPNDPVFMDVESDACEEIDE